MAALRFSLKPVPPFRLDLTVWALRRSAKNEVDAWDGETYRRVVVLGERPVLLQVFQGHDRPSDRIEVDARGERLYPSDRFAIASTLEQMLGLRMDLAKFYAIAREHPKLDELVTRYKGLKAPRFGSIFEALVNGIACQQLSLEAGLSLLNNLSRHAGLAKADGGRVFHAFPRVEEISRMRLRSFRNLGFSTSKGLALKSLATSVLRGEFDPEEVRELPNQAAVEKLEAIRGIGRWTAEYVLLRGMGRYDLFPGDDVGARAKLAKWLGMRGPVDYDRVRRTMRYLGAYRGLMYFHLLLDGLEKSGQLRSDDYRKNVEMM